MSLIENFFHSLRSALNVDTTNDVEERYLAAAIDHADLERRIASQSHDHLSMAAMNIGR
jgi:hypothetical protein